MSRRQRVYGVTKCFECHRRLAPDADVVEVEAEEQRWGQDSAGFRRGPMITVHYRWHRACRDSVLLDIEISRARGEVRRSEDTLDLARELSPTHREKWLPRIEADLTAAREALARLEARR